MLGIHIVAHWVATTHIEANNVAQGQIGDPRLLATGVIDEGRTKFPSSSSSTLNHSQPVLVPFHPFTKTT